LAATENANVCTSVRVKYLIVGQNSSRNSRAEACVHVSFGAGPTGILTLAGAEEVLTLKS
jgi:hypothetical protein